jgi:hypothetical protein
MLYVRQKLAGASMLVFANKQDMVCVCANAVYSVCCGDALPVPLQAGALSSAEIAEALDLGSELFHVSECAGAVVCCFYDVDFHCAPRVATGISNHAAVSQVTG